MVKDKKKKKKRAGAVERHPTEVTLDVKIETSGENPNKHYMNLNILDPLCLIFNIFTLPFIRILSIIYIYEGKLDY